MKDFKPIQEELSQYTGTYHFYKRLFEKSVYTDGFFTFMNLTNTHWLYDIIETEILSLAIKGLLNIDTYQLQFKASDDFVQLFLIDYQDAVIWKKSTFSDFEYSEDINFIVGWDGEKLTTCLISEN